jgi:hypothetical protein
MIKVISRKPYYSSEFPDPARDPLGTAGDRRSPKFQRHPFERDVVSDPGQATMPRITASLMLRSPLIPREGIIGIG